MKDSTSRAAAVAAARPRYQADLAGGVERFRQPRRPDCPWCGSTRLRQRLRTTDLLQRKPGRFVLDRCDDCGHVFQNPRLTAEGLEFYYRDFYDGLGEKNLEGVFSGQDPSYHARARSLLPHDDTPKNWLDVGTGHGHFCAAARAVLPDTRFDGLDFGEGVELAARAGRIDRALRGTLVELTDELTESYDAVSMFHYLEHTPEPKRELLAARQVLRPGGHLLIDVPDPESRWARVLGRWWLPWFQPQHLQLMPVANLRRELTSLGFTVVAEQHAEAHIAADLLGAVYLLLNSATPPEDAPWHPRPATRSRRALRTAAFVCGIPALLAATAADRLLIARLAHRLGLSNAYRLVARKN
ncbi:class I SAM-dependent methyltransferase [Streptomyces capparidis]